MTREQAIKTHTELMKKYNILCSPNKDYMPDGMLYYKTEEDEFSFLEITSHDPIIVVPILEDALSVLFN